MIKIFGVNGMMNFAGINQEQPRESEPKMAITDITIVVMLIIERGLDPNGIRVEIAIISVVFE